MADPAPTNWNKNNRACKTTWLTLLLLDQHQSAFAQAGAIKMEQLSFWSGGGSADFRAVRAETLLNQLDNNFRLVRGAEFEQGIDEPTAKAALRGVLLDGEQNTRWPCRRYAAFFEATVRHYQESILREQSGQRHWTARQSSARRSCFQKGSS